MPFGAELREEHVARFPLHKIIKILQAEFNVTRPTVLRNGITASIRQQGRVQRAFKLLNKQWPVTKDQEIISYHVKRLTK